MFDRIAIGSGDRILKRRSGTSVLAKHMCLSLTFSSVRVRVCVFAMLIAKHAMSNSQPLPGTDPAAQRCMRWWAVS